MIPNEILIFIKLLMLIIVKKYFLIMNFINFI
jgi:hypothetical protein